MQTMQQVRCVAKSLAGLLVGWALGHGLLWAAFLLAAVLGSESTDAADRGLLGGMLLAIGLLVVLLVSAGLAELRRMPAWLASFLLGIGTAPALTIFGYVLYNWEAMFVD